MNARGLSAQSLAHFSEGREILLNPDDAQLAKALRKVQARARTNLLDADLARAVYRRVLQEGASSACAGLLDCPRSFRFGVTSTVIQVARLTDKLIGCSIGRAQVLPGEKGVAPVAADPFENPRSWLKEVVSVFWTVLGDEQIAALQHRAVSVAMELAARSDRCKTHAHGADRASIKRRLQIQALFRSSQPVYVSELKLSLTKVATELGASGVKHVNWRDFQYRWPSIAARYKRDLLELFRNGNARVHALAQFRMGSPRYSLSFATWSGEQTVFASTQIVFQVCSQQLSTHEGAGHPSTFKLRKLICQLAEHSPHPVTPQTVGWFRVHLDDLHRLAFIDEVQSDVMEQLLEFVRAGDPAGATLSREFADWQLNGFSSIQHWASAIGYRLAMHSEQSAAAIESKTRSARKWKLYYGSLIRRFGLKLQERTGYPAAIFVLD